MDHEVIETPEPITSIPKAIRRIRATLSCTKYQDGLSPNDIRELEQLERPFGRLTIEKQHQTTLDSFWNGKNFSYTIICYNDKFQREAIYFIRGS